MSFYLKPFEDLIVEQRKNAVWITLNRPEASNAYSISMVQGLVEVLKYADIDTSVRVIVITGAGKNFCAGGDLKSMRGKTGMFAGESNQLREAYQAGIQQIPLTFSSLKTPVIAMVNGAAVGAGCDLSAMSVKFFLYTMVGSLLMLVAIFFLIKSSADVTGVPSASFATLSQLNFAFDGSSFQSVMSSPQTWLFLAFALAFVIKVPMVPFHTWLPDAHVQAPTVGSVFLAAVLLKLGTYGLMRIAIPFFPQAAYYFSNFFILMGVIGIIYGAFCALNQNDFKKLVAYSSVSHMGYIMVGLFAFQKVAIAGSLYQMINHGISAGGLFMIVGFLYERLHTRNLEEFGGLSKTVPVMAVAFMIMTLSSVALPGSNGFVGEFPILLGAFQTHPWFALFAGTGVIFGAVYALKAYQMVMLGPQTRTDLDHLHDLNLREVVAMIVMTIFVFGIGFFPKAFFWKSDATLDSYSTSLLQKVGSNGNN